ncbi:hypothetical protein MLD38_040793 [Melastoma candidum]|nr:hypothetical protein MLD38_040793 [Melastoma candidum]
MSKEGEMRKLSILYATQTGNALDAAERISRESERRGCKAILFSLDQYDAGLLPCEDIVIFVVSSTGQGDTPDSMKVLWRFLLQRYLNPSWLDGLHYAVFGFLLSEIQSTKLVDKPKYHIKYHAVNEVHSESSTISVLQNWENEIQKARGMSPGRFSGCTYRPDCFLNMVKNQHLTESPSIKDVRHFEFEFMSTAIPYRTGDILEILPGQNHAVVDAFLERCNLDPELLITVHSREEKDHMLDNGRDDLYKYNKEERRTFLMVLEDFRSVQLPLEWLVQLAPPLKTNAFSISSSPLVHPNQVHLTGLSFRHGLRKAVFLYRLHRYPSFLLDLGLVVRSAFLYKDFWLSHAKSDGVLSESKGGGFFVAFSRDQARKVYVQDKMREHGPQVWSLMNSGAAVYVAGSSTKMPSDDWSALEDVVAKEGEVPKESAVRWMRSLEKSGRYHVEAWS